MRRNPLRIDSFHPTIGSAYDAVEGYMQHLTAQLGAEAVAIPLPVRPIDALLIQLLAMHQTADPTVIDLAGAPTWGVSTLLCVTNSSIRRVVTLSENATQKWQTILDQFLCEWNVPTVECIKVEATCDAFATVSDPQAPVLAIVSSKAVIEQQSFALLEDWLERAPQAVLVVLGVEKTGDCSSLASLILRCTGSRYRLALPRELAPALVESRIALVTRRDYVDLDSMLSRIGLLFANQFPFLDLLKRVCNSALEQSFLNESLRGHTAGIVDPETLMTPYDLRRALLEQRQELERENLQLLGELQDVRSSLTYRILQGIRRLSRSRRVQPCYAKQTLERPKPVLNSRR